jgi:hypothetical protein
MKSVIRGLQDIQRQAVKEGATNTASASTTVPTTDTTATATTTDTTATAPIEQPKKKKWVMPVLIGSGVLVVGILVFVLLKKK